VLDLGRRPEARFIKGQIFVSKIISWQDIDYTQNASVNLVMKIELVLNEHFIESVVFKSSIFNKWIDMCWSSCFGTISVVRDLESEKSI
jgi:hypothetical protein